MGYTLNIQSIRNTFLILSCTPFCPQNSLNSLVGAWTLQGVESVPQGRWPMLRKCFPKLCQVGWMSFGFWTALDTHGKLLSLENPAALQFLTHANRCACLWTPGRVAAACPVANGEPNKLNLIPYPFQRHLNILSCPFTL